MKTRKTGYILLITAFCGFLITGCKKDNSTSTPLPGTEVSQVQNADVQDAIADKNESDIDNTLDQLQVSNYSVSALKDAFVMPTRTITVDHPDSTTFPKVITIIYNNFQDSTATESFVRNGEIDITVTAGSNKQLVTRTQVFKNYSVTTDSTTITVSGTRTVTRTALTAKFNGFTSLRVTATDQITADLSYAITKTGDTDSLKFTRIVDKTRSTFLHYNNAGGSTWQTIRFKNVPAEDTVKWYGTVTGVNENDNTYSKGVSAGDPIVMTFYNGTPVLSSGTLNLNIEATTTKSFTFTFKEDPDHLHLTLVTVTNNNTGKTKSFDRRISRKLIKWW